MKRVRSHHRAAAVTALGAGAVTVLLVLGILIENLAYALLAVLGLALAGGGGWFFATSGWPRRAVGVGGIVAGVALVIWALASAVDASTAVARLGAVAIAAAVATIAARIAVSSGHSTVFVRTQAPLRPVLLCNPWSGGGKVARFGLDERARALGVDVVMLADGLDLEELARGAIDNGADCLGMAGGDGSQALVASVAIEAGLPFVCVAAGTRNHFALDLGLDRDDPPAGLAGFTSGLERRVDYATVESDGRSRLFVNNVSLGVYATVVQDENYRDNKAATMFESLPELLGSQSEPFDLSFSDLDGSVVTGAFLVMVSNNPYVLNGTSDMGQRRAVDTGRLGVFAVSTATGTDAAGLVALSALGAQRRSPSWHEFSAERFQVDSRGGTAYAGIDGEALDLATPLVFRSHPGGLRMMVPPDNPDAVRRRHARDVGLDDLISIARGEGPVGRQSVPESAGRIRRHRPRLTGAPRPRPHRRQTTD